MRNFNECKAAVGSEVRDREWIEVAHDRFNLFDQRPARVAGPIALMPNVMPGGKSIGIIG
jgi:hypothetical protein